MRFPHFFTQASFLIRSHYPSRWQWTKRFLLSSIACIAVVLGGFPAISSGQVASNAALSLAQPTENFPAEKLEILRQSWMAYRDRFIQADGRVIDWEDDQRSTSEGQAYAMLRAVLIGDRETFDRTFTWAENNLNRKNEAGETTDRLWAWKWGKNSRGEWGTIDPNFASDADIDAVTALILAARRWHNPDYVDQARSKLKDLWALSIVSAADQTPYLLPGPKSVFQPQPNQLILNPSYLAPYAFRLFAQVDNELNWMRLVDSSYQTIEQSATISEVGLPSDWVMLDLQKGEFHPVTTASQLQSRYGFDAYRVWWRVALDAIWFQEPKALAYLENHLTHLQQEWRNQQKLPAQISLQGKPMVDYEATAQYAMLYPALQRVDSTMADQIYQQKLLPAYKNGFWDNNSAYYTQNLAWFALLPATPPAQIDRTASTGRSNCFQFMSRLNR